MSHPSPHSTTEDKSVDRLLVTETSLNVDDEGGIESRIICKDVDKGV